MAATHTYLALGDSYTMGEMVPLYESFPYQAVQLQRRAGHDFAAPENVAKTGWTTDELQSQMNETKFQPNYELVSLLIGVNNQYRWRSVDEYAKQFEALLQQAIHLAGDRPQHVTVLSIPDWSVTPFAKDRERKKIAKEIDDYNARNQAIAMRLQSQYLDITPGTREAVTDHSLLTTDGLHPSGKEYARWAARLVALVRQIDYFCPSY